MDVPGASQPASRLSLYRLSALIFEQSCEELTIHLLLRASKVNGLYTTDLVS